MRSTYRNGDDLGPQPPLRRQRPLRVDQRQGRLHVRRHGPDERHLPGPRPLRKHGRRRAGDGRRATGPTCTGPVELVGNGAFQVTGLEIATAAKLGLNPIVVLFDNGSYSMLRFIDRQRNYYRLIPWDFAGLARAVRTEATTVNTQAGIALALARAGARAAVCHRRDDLSGRHLSDPPPAHRTRGAEGGGRGRLTLAERRR